MNADQEITLKLPAALVAFLLQLLNEQPRRVVDGPYLLISSQLAQAQTPAKEETAKETQ
jgi:hypothetical protein